MWLVILDRADRVLEDFLKAATDAIHAAVSTPCTGTFCSPAHRILGVPTLLYNLFSRDPASLRPVI